MPEGVLAPFVVPRNMATPRADAPAPVTPEQAPVKAASPQEANAVTPKYPAIPEPGQDPVSLQATVLRLKEAVEMMTGTVGGSETDLVGGYLLLQKSTANSSARLEIINQVTANANFAMATHMLILDAEFKAVTGVNPTGNTLKAHLDETFTVYADADEALAFRSLNMETALQMTTGTSASARLTSIEETNVTQGNFITTHTSQITTLDAQINTETIGIAARLQVTSEVAIQANATAVEASVKFGVTGTINSVSGGFTFLGVLKNDGSVGYSMEFEVDTFIIKDPSTSGAKEVFSYFDGKFIFTGDVAIYGNLVVNGTVVTSKIGTSAVTQSLASRGVNGTSVNMALRAGAKINIIVSISGYNALTSASVAGTIDVYVNGSTFSNSSFGIGYTFLYQPSLSQSWPLAAPTTMQCQYTAPSDGNYLIECNHTWPITAGGITMDMLAIELAR